MPIIVIAELCIDASSTDCGNLSSTVLILCVRSSRFFSVVSVWGIFVYTVCLIIVVEVTQKSHHHILSDSDTCVDEQIEQNRAALVRPKQTRAGGMWGSL